MEGRFERAAAVAGFAFVVISFAAYVDGAATAAWSALLQLLAIIPFTVFLVGLRLRLRQTDEALAMITLLGGFGTMVIIQIWQGILVGLILLRNDARDRGAGRQQRGGRWRW